jgi:glycine/D-amino acid oxidase-like deaminating enzyme
MGRVHATGTALPDCADVVVIGAGLVGLATAFYAARAKLGRVIVLERRGDLADLTSAHSAEGVRLEWDAPENIAMVRESIDIFAHFEVVVGVPGVSAGLTQRGYLFVSSSIGVARRRARLKERVAWWHQNGLPDVEYMNGNEAQRRFPFVGPDAEAAHFRAGDGFVSAAAVARGFAGGGRFDTFLHTSVAEIETHGDRVTGVRTADGSRVNTGTVVIAAGPFSAALAETAGARLLVHNRRRHGLIVLLPRGIVAPEGPMVVDADLGLYWRPRPEGLFIGWEQALDWDQRPSPAMDPVPSDWRYLLRVRRHGRRLTKFWEQIPFTDVFWHTGQYVAPASADGRPIIGPHPQVSGLWINTAYEGRGIMASPGGGRLLVDLMQHPGDGNGNPFRVFIDARANPPDQMVL